MFAKSFLALNGNGRLTCTRTAHIASNARYTCHLSGSVQQHHLEYITERPWFEHRPDALTENRRQHYPYVNPLEKEVRRILKLRRYVADAQPVILRTDWHCSGCGNNYHGKRYCLTCRTGNLSHVLEEATL